MKLLLLGSGGREHALAWKIAQSPKIEKLYIAPGNAGTSEVGENVAVIDIYHDYYPHDTWDDLYLYTDDGLHPNEAGREKIAQTIAERLNKE